MNEINLQDVIDDAISKGKTEVELEGGVDYIVDKSVAMPLNIRIIGQPTFLDEPEQQSSIAGGKDKAIA